MHDGLLRPYNATLANETWSKSAFRLYGKKTCDVHPDVAVKRAPPGRAATIEDAMGGGILRLSSDSLLSHSLPAQAPLSCSGPGFAMVPHDRMQIVVGAFVGPADRSRRGAARSTWMQWAKGEPNVLVCFVVGLRGVPSTLRMELTAEAAERHDLLLLRGAPDGCTLSLVKILLWWRAAS